MANETTIIETNNISIKNISDLDDLTQETNSISKKEGIVVNNVVFPLQDEHVKVIKLSELTSKNIECGRVINNIYLAIEQEEDNFIVVFDFNDIETVSENFCKDWTKLLLQTKSKIFTINMNPAISATFSTFIKNNLLGIDEE